MHPSTLRIPRADLTKPEQQKRCFHFSNLRPLWAQENLAKNDRMVVGGQIVSARKFHAS